MEEKAMKQLRWVEVQDDDESTFVFSAMNGSSRRFKLQQKWSVGDEESVHYEWRDVAFVGFGGDDE
jgi:hypothetical protein